MISNSNWSEWSTIRGVITWLNSKSDERKAWGQCTSTIIPWIAWHEVQLLINRIYNKFRSCKCLLRTSFQWKVCNASPMRFKTLKTVGNSVKEVTKAHVTDVQITWVSNYRCLITKVQIGHPCDLMPITWQLGPLRTNHDREFCYRHDYNQNGCYTPNIY